MEVIGLNEPKMIQSISAKDKDCAYPNCDLCDKDDCDKGENDIAALLKRRRWAMNPELHRQKLNDYRKKQRESLPHCDKCSDCVQVTNQKGDGYRRICVSEMRLIEQKVSNSPRWCRKRKEKK